MHLRYGALLAAVLLIVESAAVLLVVESVAVLLGVDSAAVLLGAVSVADAQENPRTYRQAAKHCQTGSAALQEGNLDLARQSFESALALIPDLAEAHVGLGHIAMRASRWDAALAEYQKARESFLVFTKRMNAHEFRRYFDARMQADIFRDEINQIKNSPYSKVPQEQREALAAPLESEVAHADQMAIPGKGEEPAVPAELLFLIGNAQFRLDRVEEAQASWEECVRVNPRFPPVYNNLAIAYFKLGRYADARFNLERAAALGVPVNPAFRKAVDDALARMQVVPPPS